MELVAPCVKELSQHFPERKEETAWKAFIRNSMTQAEN
jgi:hypothetical protein